MVIDKKERIKYISISLLNGRSASRIFSNNPLKFMGKQNKQTTT